MFGRGRGVERSGVEPEPALELPFSMRWVIDGRVISVFPNPNYSKAIEQEEFYKEVFHKGLQHLDTEGYDIRSAAAMSSDSHQGSGSVDELIVVVERKS